MRIIKFTAENIKKLKAVEITPAGNIIEVVGGNGQGKSSVLDAIFYALSGTEGIPAKAVRLGEEKAFVQLALGDATTEIVVTRHFTAGGTTRLTVESKDGARFPSPQRLLDELVGALSFDPLEFTRLKPKAQLEALRRVVKLDVDLDKLDGQTAKAFEKRTELNREVKALEARLTVIPEPTPDTPDAPVVVGDLVQKLQEANSFNIERENSRREVDNKVREIQAWRDQVAGYKKRAREVYQELEKKIQEITADYNRRQETFLAQAKDLSDKADNEEWQLMSRGPIPEPAPVAEIADQLKRAEDTNKQVERRRTRERLKLEIKSLVDKVQDLTTTIEANNHLRQHTIAKAQMPVDGLTFGEGEVMFQGLPLGNASAAEQLRVSVGVAMAANPRLRILRVKDGSLLDDASLRLLASLAETNNFQVWLERLTGGGDLPCVVMEDGAVQAAPHPDEHDHQLHQMDTDGTQAHPDAH